MVEQTAAGVSGVAGSFTLMKSINTNLILEMIREKGPIARSEIAKLTRLTPATVTNITSELLEIGLITEGERGKSSGGRKPVMLLMNPGKYYIISANITAGMLTVALTNLFAEILEIKRCPISQDMDYKEVIKLITDMIEPFVTQNRVIAGIGMGIHGLVDVNSGISIFAPNLGWKNVPIRDIIQDKFGIPVKVDNDVKAATLGESWYGKGRNTGSFVCVNVDYGVGGGIFIDGRIYRGINGGAGEIGHTTIEKDGPLCSCGNYGCLQTFISEDAIVRRYHEKAPDRTATCDVIYRSAASGDKLAREVVRETGEYLGIGIANIINTFNPQNVIITGSIINGGNILLDTVRDTVFKRAMTNSTKAADIVFSKLAEMAPLKGATALVLREIFNNLSIITGKPV